jgi:hypothetical protein
VVISVGPKSLSQDLEQFLTSSPIEVTRRLKNGP